MNPLSMEWISVKDQLPEKASSVPVVGLGRYVTIAEWYKDSGWSLGREELFGSKDITHWMPLPDPPVNSQSDSNQGQKSQGQKYVQR